MKQNCFQFNKTFFEQHEGTVMGNALSPFIANLFMSRFETRNSATFQTEREISKFVSIPYEPRISRK